MTPIPAIDIIDGKCVRLTRGDYAQVTVYNEDPLENARRFEDAGLTRLHLVDLDGARAGQVKNWKTLERIAGKTSLQVDFSGGLGSEEQVAIAFNSGATWAAVGSKAVTEEAGFLNWITTFGPGRFLLGADVRDRQIVIRGWTETTTLGVEELIARYRPLGLAGYFCTDVGKDGMMQGPALDLYQSILEKEPGLPLIASGGIRSLEDLDQLQALGCQGAIIGKAIYEGRIRPEELTRYC